MNETDESTVDIESDSNLKKSDSNPWYLCEFSRFKRIFNYIDSCYSFPFIQPKLYFDRFDDLKDVDLFLLVGNHDITMDDNISLASQWKGKMNLDIFDDVVHCYVAFGMFSQINKEAIQVTTRRFQEACGLVS